MNKLEDAPELNKISNINDFYEDFKTNFKNTIWWKQQQEEVKPIDTLDRIIDGMMAAMTKTGEWTEKK